MLYRKGNTGKSKYLAVLNEIIGSENGINIAISKLSDRFALADVYAKRLIYNGTMSKEAFADASVFKELTGGDSVRAEPKGQAAFSFRFNGVCIYVCNNKTDIVGDIGVHVFERPLLIPCMNVVPKVERDREIILKLLKDKEYIVRWALEGLKRLIANNYNFSYLDKIQRELDEYRKESNSILALCKCSMHSRGTEQLQNRMLRVPCSL